MRTNQMWRWAVVIGAALVMTFVLAGVSFAGGSTGSNDDDDDLICVQGYVINHREQAVDGTEVNNARYDATTGQIVFDPDSPLRIFASAEINASAVITEAEVDEDGFFEWEELPEGEWNFMLPLPEEWGSISPPADRWRSPEAQTWAETGATLLEEDEDVDCYQIVFKIRREFDITVIKWEELRDGTVQPGEDWEITVEPVKDPFVKSQTEETDAGGVVNFTITPGKWRVFETVKKDWLPVTPSRVELTLDAYDPPGAKDPIVFKNLKPACYGEIVVTKNGLGRAADGSLVWLGPLAGWKLTLTRADGFLAPLTAYTDASGQVTFEDLWPGVYEIEEEVQPGWKEVGDNPRKVILLDCDTIIDADTGQFIDNDRGGVLFENEEVNGELIIKGKKLYHAWSGPTDGLGLSGWVITATLKGTDISTTTVTNGLGEYEFDFDSPEMKAWFGLPANETFAGHTIEICEDVPDNWIPLLSECVNVLFPYPVPKDYEGAEVYFVNIQDPPVPAANAIPPTHRYYPAVEPTAQIMAPAANTRVHIVVRGETMQSIANRYGLSTGTLSQANGLSSTRNIYIGQRLIIP